MTGAKLGNADMRDANLTNVTLTDANISMANISGATTTGLISGFLTTTGFVPPDGYRIDNGYLVGPGVDLSGAQLSESWQTYDDTVLYGANLTGTNLTNANLTKISLAHTTLTGAQLSGANMTGVISGNITGTPNSLPANWRLDNGYLFGPYANLGMMGENFEGDLQGVDLQGANLTQDNFVNVNLAGSNLSDTNMMQAGIDAGGASTLLQGCTSGGITSVPAGLPIGWTLVNGTLVGPSSNA